MRDAFIMFCIIGFSLLLSKCALADAGDEVFRSVLELMLDFLGDKLDEAIPPQPVEPVETIEV